MHTIRTAAFAALAIALVFLPAARAADLPRAEAPGKPAPHFDLINATFDSVTELAVAAAGSGDFRPVDLGRPLQGGLNAMTFDLPAGGCLRDLQVVFRNGRVARFASIDVCRSHGLRLTAR